MEKSKAISNSKAEPETKAAPNITKQYDSIRNHSVLFPSGISYEGEWLGKLKHGYGVQTWPDGARY